MLETIKLSCQTLAQYQQHALRFNHFSVDYKDDQLLQPSVDHKRLSAVDLSFINMFFLNSGAILPTVQTNNTQDKSKNILW